MEQSRNYYIYAYMPERGVFNKTPSEYAVCSFDISACSDHYQHGKMADREEISEAETSDPAGICAEIEK